MHASTARRRATTFGSGSNEAAYRSLASRTRSSSLSAAPVGAARSRDHAVGGEGELGDLERVQRGALAQVVAYDEKDEPVRRGRVLADAPHEHVVDPGRPAGGGEVVERHARCGGE